MSPQFVKGVESFFYNYNKKKKKNFNVKCLDCWSKSILLQKFRWFLLIEQTK